MGIPISDLVQSVKGGLPHNQGTWVHPYIKKIKKFYNKKVCLFSTLQNITSNVMSYCK